MWYTVVIDKPDETAIACQPCQQGHLVQRRSRYGKIFHSAIATFGMSVRH